MSLVLQIIDFQINKSNFSLYKIFMCDFQTLQIIPPELWCKQNIKNQRYENYLP